MAGLIYSLKKSWKLAKLQRQICVNNVDEMISTFQKGIIPFQNGQAAKKREDAFEAYLNLCESDSNVKRILNDYKLNRNDLKEIYQVLLRSGLGQWIKSHYVALSTLAYAQPLKLYLDLKQQGSSHIEIASAILDYWKKN